LGFWGESPLEWRRFGMADLRNGGPSEWRTRTENARAAQPTAVRTAYCVNDVDVNGNVK